MNTQDIACQQAFVAGDLAYYKGANCTQAAANANLIAQTKKALNTKTILLVSGAVLATGVLIYLSVRK